MTLEDEGELRLEESADGGVMRLGGCGVDGAAEGGCWVNG